MTAPDPKAVDYVAPIDRAAQFHIDFSGQTFSSEDDARRWVADRLVKDYEAVDNWWKIFAGETVRRKMIEAYEDAANIARNVSHPDAHCQLVGEEVSAKIISRMAEVCK